MKTLGLGRIVALLLALSGPSVSALADCLPDDMDCRAATPEGIDPLLGYLGLSEGDDADLSALQGGPEGKDAEAVSLDTIIEMLGAP